MEDDAILPLGGGDGRFYCVGIDRGFRVNVWLNVAVVTALWAIWLFIFVIRKKAAEDDDKW